jgi:hypothetical protein
MAAKPGTRLDAWADIFDAAHLEHACAAIADAMRGDLDRAGMAATMRRHLLAPLSVYQAEHWREGSRRSNVVAADRFYAVAEDLADALDAARHPFNAAEVADLTSALRVAWLEFIAHGAGSAIYHDMVKAHEQRTEASRRLRGAAAKLTPELVAERVKAEGGHFPDWLAHRLAGEFMVSERTVYRRLADARARGLIP